MALVNNPIACREHYRTNTANVEVYYEQMGYESAVESPVYTVSVEPRMIRKQKTTVKKTRPCQKFWD